MLFLISKISNLVCIVIAESKEFALTWDFHKTHCWKVRFKKEIECLAKDVLRDMTHITQSVYAINARK